jgi:hypothetical protein
MGSDLSPINADRKFNQAITTLPRSRGRLVQSLVSTEAEGCRHAACKCALTAILGRSRLMKHHLARRSLSRFRNSARRIFGLSRPTHWFAKSCGVQRASDTYRRSGVSDSNEFCISGICFMKQLRAFLASASASTSTEFAAIASGISGSAIVAENMTSDSPLKMWQMIAIALH